MSPPTLKLYRNPMALAQEWQWRIDSGEVPSRAALARQLGVSRAHVTQVLRLLDLAAQAKEAILSLGDPIEGQVIGAHTLRSLPKLPTEEQESGVLQLLGRNGW